jgi:hypothetical protein
MKLEITQSGPGFGGAETGAREKVQLCSSFGGNRG